MATKAQAKKNLEAVLNSFPNTTKAAAIFDVTEGTVRSWLRRGNLNGVAVETVLKVCEVSGLRPEDYVAEEH